MTPPKNPPSAMEPTRVSGFHRFVSYFILGYRVARWFEFVHGPTADLQPPYDFDDPALAPFVRDGVFLKPQKTMGYPSLDFALLCHTEKTVTIDKVRLTGLGACASKVHQVNSPEVLAIDYKRKSGLRSKHFQAVGLTTNEFKEISREGLRLELSVRVGDEQGAGEMVFDFTRVARETGGWLT